MRYGLSLLLATLLAANCWANEGVVRELTAKESELKQKSIKWGNDIVTHYSTSAPKEITPTVLDEVYKSWLADEGEKFESIKVTYGLGVLISEYITHSKGAKLQVFVDSQGADFVIKCKLDEESIHVFPVNYVLKRVRSEQKEVDFFDHFYNLIDGYAPNGCS
ncbi:hypothetical protein [Vibrio sonorensis]|uniref:hypothetical protein n=1 Tax=Vibrio sonorensis TaxID=1004316 RepID=UPI0008D8F548|nr:hypothetical protein [Vibrio sonorensis]